MYSGGLVGLASNRRTGVAVTINNSYVIGDVSSTNYSYAAHSGGLVGWGNVITINNSYAIGNISAFCNGDIDEEPHAFAGGLIGGGDVMITVSNSYAISNVSASSADGALSGGIAGFAGGQGTTSNSYASGTVTATGLYAGAGGIFGNANDLRTNISVFYNSQKASQATGGGESDGILAKTSDELRQQSTFVGWDFENIWAIDPTKNDGFPYFDIKNVTSIRNTNKNNNRYGIKFANNIVSEKAEIGVILPNNEKVAEMKIVIYDNIGNVVYEGNETTWDLTNRAGRKVANGAYLVVVEARGVSGKSYWYSAKLGVNR
jgi:hypothetical protein